MIKATTSRSHVVPKEKHVIRLKSIISTSRLNASYVAGGLLKRLQSAQDWLTALKSLIVVHRLIRETDAAAFMEELLRAGDSGARGRGGRVLAVDNFMDTSTMEGRFDYSEWVRAYGKYLNESLEVFSAVAWHVDLEGAGKASKLRSLDPKDLLQQMPYLQRLQRRLVDCLPRGQAAQDDVVLLSLSMVMRESFKLYKALSEGVINLADCFFTMNYLDAVKGLEVYREALDSGETLATYYSSLQSMPAVRAVNELELPTLSQPPADFIEEMERYVKEAPRPESASSETAAAATRRNPIRKGRLSQPHMKPSSASSSDYTSGGLRDPGMLLPYGGGRPGSATGASTPLESPREELEEVEEEQEVIVEEEVEPEPEVVAAPPIIDLLGFDDASVAFGGNDQLHADGSGQHQVSATAQPSAMDLLGELDFGMLSFDGSGGQSSAQHAQQAPTSTVSSSQPAIHDAFVVRAAADVYGRPPPLHETMLQGSAPSPHGIYAQTPGNVPPPAWATHQQHQLIPAQYAYSNNAPYGGQSMSGYAPQQGQQYGHVHQASGYGTMQYSTVSPREQFGTMNQWGQPQAAASQGQGQYTMSGHQQAGTRDPFAVLPGLPQKQQSPSGNSPGSAARGWS